MLVPDSAEMSGGQARPEASLLEELKAEVILTPDGIAYAYNTGVFLSAEQSQDTVAVAIIACVEDRFLVAVPGPSWNRKADKRKLPPGTLQKAISLSVAGCAADSREEAADGISIHIWVGWLKKESRSALDFSGEDAPTIDFVDKDTEEQCFPLADALVEVAQEKFQVSSASPEFVGPERITALEEKLAAMQASMARLIEIHEGKGDAGFATADEGSSGRMYPTAPKSAAKATLAAKAKVRTQPAPHAPPPGLASLHAYPGLDPGVVASALQAGIPPEHLQTMSNVLKSGPAKLEDYPRSGAPLQQAHPVSDEEDVEEPAPPTMGDPMADAVVKFLPDHGQNNKACADQLQLGRDAGPSRRRRIWVGRCFFSHGSEARSRKTWIAKSFSGRCFANLAERGGQHGSGFQFADVAAQCINGVHSTWLVRAQVKDPAIHSDLPLDLGHLGNFRRSTHGPERSGPCTVLSPSRRCRAGKLGPRLLPPQPGVPHGACSATIQLPKPCAPRHHGNGHNTTFRPKVDRSLCRSSEAIGHIRRDETKIDLALSRAGAESVAASRSCSQKQRQSERQRQEERKGGGSGLSGGTVADLSPHGLPLRVPTDCSLPSSSSSTQGVWSPSVLHGREQSGKNLPCGEPDVASAAVVSPAAGALRAQQNVPIIDEVQMGDASAPLPPMMHDIAVGSSRIPCQRRKNSIRLASDDSPALEIQNWIQLFLSSHAFQATEGC